MHNHALVNEKAFNIAKWAAAGIGAAVLGKAIYSKLANLTSEARDRNIIKLRSFNEDFFERPYSPLKMKLSFLANNIENKDQKNSMDSLRGVLNENKDNDNDKINEIKAIISVLLKAYKELDDNYSKDKKDNALAIVRGEYAVAKLLKNLDTKLNKIIDEKELIKKCKEKITETVKSFPDQINIKEEDSKILQPQNIFASLLATYVYFTCKSNLNMLGILFREDTQWNRERQHRSAIYTNT